MDDVDRTPKDCRRSVPSGDGAREGSALGKATHCAGGDPQYEVGGQSCGQYEGVCGMGGGSFSESREYGELGDSGDLGVVGADGGTEGQTAWA